jgi:hypothetical protein
MVNNVFALMKTLAKEVGGQISEKWNTPFF